MNPSLYHPAPGRFHTLFAGLTLLCLSTAGAATYTFEGLGAGNLAGQDGWFALAPNGSQSFIVQSGSGFDTSLVAKAPNSGGANFNGRPNDGNFSFSSFAAAVGGILQFDTRVNFPTGDNQNISFFLADSTNITVSASPQIQYGNSGGSTPIINVRPAQFGGGDTTVTIPTSGPNAVANGDWITVRLTMDFTTNGGNGFGDISFANLTQGGGFISLGTANLGMLNPGVTPSAWNAMWLRSDFANNVTIDNLTITAFTAVPELNGAWIAAACALLLGGHFVRQRKGART